MSRYGVGHLVVERHRSTAHTPRAHIINQRTIEIFRHLRISDRFHAVATPQHLMANNLWVTTLAGLEVARSETWGASAERAADYRAPSPEPMANCLGFALLTGVGGEAWSRAAAEASARAGVPVRVHVIGGREGVTDPYGEWACLRELETTGCVLVRPDRHVAWRSTRYTPDSGRQFSAAIEQALGLAGR